MPEPIPPARAFIVPELEDGVDAPILLIDRHGDTGERGFVATLGYGYDGGDVWYLDAGDARADIAVQPDGATVTISGWGSPESDDLTGAAPPRTPWSLTRRVPGEWAELARRHHVVGAVVTQDELTPESFARLSRPDELELVVVACEPEDVSPARHRAS